MGDNVWIQWFVQAVTSLSNLSRSSTGAQRQENPTFLPAAPASVADSSSISKTIQENPCLLRIKRDRTRETMDGLFGDMDYNGTFVGHSMERKAVAIPLGLYEAHLEESPHFGFQTPHIDVPGRTYIECHPANRICQLEGCVAIGTTIDNGELDNSRAAFDGMMKLLPQTFRVLVE